MKLLLTISYLGTNYHGFQVQPNAVTVQSTLQDAVEKIFGVRCPVTGCSRTDSGVHANMFCCTVDTAEAQNILSPQNALRALNSVLPEDIAVLKAAEVPDSFHPRYDVLKKRYIYLIRNSQIRNPFTPDREFFYPHHLDEEKMNSAAAHFIGEHDFAAFCASGSSVKDTVRTIYECNVCRNGDTVKLVICGNGFLYNMVRIITGTLIEVSSGKITENEIDEIILSRDSSRAGYTAPACGLYLDYVTYPEGINE